MHPGSDYPADSPPQRLGLNAARDKHLAEHARRWATACASGRADLSLGAHKSEPVRRFR